MSIQSSILSMMSSVGTAAAVPKAISAMNKEGVKPEAEKPMAPTQPSQGSLMMGYTGTNPMINTNEMQTPFQRVQMERQRKELQAKFMAKAKEEFGKINFSNVNLHPGGNK